MPVWPTDSRPFRPKPPQCPRTTTEPVGVQSPTTDLVGQWRATRNGDAFDLTVTGDNQFTWKATPKGKQPIVLSGPMTTTGDTLVLDGKTQGTMVARVISEGADQFRFVVTDGPPGDKGLEFQRVGAGG